MLKVTNLSKSYKTHQALSNVSFDVPKGKIVGLLGHNGAGKTTLIRIITRIIEANEGVISFNNEPLQSKHSKQIGYLPEERGLYKKMFVEEYLLYLAQLRDVPKPKALELIDKHLTRLQLVDRRKEEIGNLSKGNQQKVQFIAAILHDPSFLILDEPFSGFDPVNEQLIIDHLQELKAQGVTIMLSTHRMDSVEELCDSIVFVNQGKVVYEGTVEALKAQYLDTDFVLWTNQAYNNTAWKFLEKVGNKYRYEGKKASELPSADLLLAVEKKQKTLKEIFIDKVQTHS